MLTDLRVLIVAEHASLKFGGEASLPLHYFRVLRQKKVETWLIVHERTRSELTQLFANDLDRIYFITDTAWHRLFWNLGKPLPHRISYFTFGLMLRWLTQLMQHRLIQKIIKEQQINVIHQPIPVSPKEPSSIYGLGVPIVIGPMNGGMNYPTAFKDLQSVLERKTISIGRSLSSLMNTLIPGKKLATTLLVANSRTRQALPKNLQNSYIIELVENGVDLTLWNNNLEKNLTSQNTFVFEKNRINTFVFVGRLIALKGVDLLLRALKKVLQTTPVRLEIIGDGPEKNTLMQLAQELDLNRSYRYKDGICVNQPVDFVGWLDQAECAKHLQNANAMILPSLHECGGAVVLEAMAMGLPVIATKWGGPADYLDDSCGILIEPKSQKFMIQGLAEAMLTLANSSELCKKMGDAGREKILNDFDWEKKVDMIMEIYQDSIQRYFL